MMPETNQTDRELLAVFAQTGSQTAFAALVERHAAMVHGVCLRVLRDHHAAQDVAQAVFLTLARKASGMRQVSSVGGWLHVVAWKLAVKTRRSSNTRRQYEEAAMRERETAATATTPVSFRDEMDAALGQLPDRYRQPLVLFHLESKSLEQTAGALGLNLKTASTRLVRGRELLRKKLVRRGVTVGSVGALTALLSAESGAATLPATLVASTVKAATGGAVSTTVAALTKGALHMLFIAKVKTVSLAAAACLVVAGSGVVAARQLSVPSSSTPTAQVIAPPVATPPTSPEPTFETAQVEPGPAVRPTVGSPAPQLLPVVEPAPSAPETFLAIPDDAAARAALLRQEPKSFRLEIGYYGSQPVATPERQFWTLNLSVKRIQRAKMPGWTWDLQISPEQALTMIDHLAQDGTLAEGKAYTGWEQWKQLTAKVPQYGLIVYYPNPTPNRKHGLDGTTTTMIGWDATTVKRLEHLRSVLTGDAADALDRLLKALDPLRK